MLNLSNQQRDFDRPLAECIYGTLTELLSAQVAEALYSHLGSHYSVSRDQIPYRLDTLVSTLQNTFGVGGKVIGRAIARRLYAQLRLEFTNTPEKTLLEYVEQAKAMLESKSA